MSTYLIKQWHKIASYYKENNLRRLVIGLIVIGLVWVFSIIISLILTLLFVGDNFLSTFSNDVPGLGFILGLVLALEIWGLIPQPVSQEEKISHKEKKENLDV